MLDVRTELTRAVRNALSALGVDESVDAAVEPSAKPEFGDWSTPAPLKSARLLRKAPPEIAAELRDLLASVPLPFVAEWTVSAPGYVNARLQDSVWAPAVIDEALAQDSAVPVPIPSGYNVVDGRTLIEHTATNPNKAAHVGHLRNACIGDSVARILRRTGHDIEVQNYIDDTGVQVADVTIGVRDLGIAQERGELFDQYCSRVYVEVCRRYETEPALLESRRAVLHDIEAGDNDVARYVKDLASKIVDRHLATMGRFDIDYDLLAWESDVLHLGFWTHAFELLKSSNAIVKVESGKLAGCWVMPSEGSDDEDDAKVFVKSDGVATYTAKDTAYQLWKFGLLGRDFRYLEWEGSNTLFTTATSGGTDGGGRFGQAKRVINVIDARQAYPQGVVKQALQRLGHSTEAEQSIHLGYEVVALSPTAAQELGVEVEPGKEMYALSGRKGIEIRADDLLDRAVARVAEKTTDTSVADSVAAGAIRYYLLKFSLNQIIAFDFDEALRTTGDTGVYLQYAHARAGGILRKVKAEGGFGEVPELLPVERALLLRIDAYRHALAEAASALSPSSLCAYAFSLASALSDFYEHTPAIVREEDKAIRNFRRRLVEASKATLGDALRTLGMAAPEKI